MNSSNRVLLYIRWEGGWRHNNMIHFAGSVRASTRTAMQTFRRGREGVECLHIGNIVICGDIMPANRVSILKREISESMKGYGLEGTFVCDR